MINKIYILFSICMLAFSSQSWSQKNVKETLPAVDEREREIAIQEKIYKMAIHNNDLGTATFAVYNIIALEPKSGSWLDSLAMLYFSRAAYDQCIHVAEDILSSSPSDTAVLELLSISQQALGLAKESLANYERLFGMSKSLHHLYEIATLQYSLKRLAECELSALQIISDPASEKQKISISVSQGQTEVIVLRAAAMNLVGVVAMEVSKFDIAEKNFRDALVLEPQFSLAKGNLDYLEKKKSEK